MKEMIAQLIKEEMQRSAQKKYYFMAGLPRSGSALLSSLLNQNPRFHSGPSSPVLDLMQSIENTLIQNEPFNLYPKNQQASETIASVITHYYSDIEQPVIIDKNIHWLSRMHYIKGYFGIEPKIICPVRDMKEILASYIALHKRNSFENNGRVNFIDRMLIRNNIPLTDDNRCMMLSGEDGIIGQSYNAIRQILMAGKQSNLLFVEYDDLVNNPQHVMNDIYSFLDEEPFEHDFTKIESKYHENGALVYGFADIYDVRSELCKTSTPPEEVLSEDILKLCENAEFWRNLDDFDDNITNEDNPSVADDGVVDADIDSPNEEAYEPTTTIGA